MKAPLLHLCTVPDWRAALAAGTVAPPSPDETGFVHLSTPEQVELPANRLFAGRRDMLLLAVSPDRLDDAGIEVRWEPGVPGDPESMRFPHAYGALPTSAVRAVLPYRPDDEGCFRAPHVPDLDAAARARLFQPSVLRRTAGREVDVTGGVAVLTDRVPVSRMHNQLLVSGPVDVPTIEAESDRVLGAAGLPHASVLITGPGRPDAGELRARGWTVEELVTMAAPVTALAGDPAPDAAGDVAEAGIEELRPLFDAGWTERAPDVTDAQLAQLTDRYLLEDAGVDVRGLAVRVAGTTVASCLVKLDGGTAWLDGLETVPEARWHGHAGELVRAAVRLASGSGADLLALDCGEHDWPRDWYARLGFRDAGRVLHAVRS